MTAESQGYWSAELLTAALAKQSKPLPANWRERIVKAKNPFYLIDYRDGFKACVAMLNGLTADFLFAARLRGQKAMATKFALHNGYPYRHFEWLVKAIDEMMHTGKPPYPVERTLLTTGIIHAAMQSLAADNRRIETPHLDVAYRATQWGHAPGEPNFK